MRVLLVQNIRGKCNGCPLKSLIGKRGIQVVDSELESDLLESPNQGAKRFWSVAGPSRRFPIDVFLTAFQFK